MNNVKINCKNCDETIVLNLNEFVDVSEMPEFKEKILDGRFFLVKCPKCGDETLIEYQMVYIDPDKKLNIYLSPDFDGSVLEDLNSLELPEEAIDKEAIFRLVETSGELIEKIMIFDRNRDDRIIELYKVVLAQQLSEDWPEIKSSDLIYYADEDECFIVWNAAGSLEGEQLTVLLNEEMYEELEGYRDELEIPPGKYAKVDTEWIEERVYTGE